MSPTTIAKALADSGLSATLSVGTKAAPSLYDIAGIARSIESLGHHHQMATVDTIEGDEALKIVTAPAT